MIKPVDISEKPGITYTTQFIGSTHSINQKDDIDNNKEFKYYMPTEEEMTKLDKPIPCVEVTPMTREERRKRAKMINESFNKKK